MRKVFCRTLSVLVVTAVAAFAADNSIGTWKLDPVKSSYTPAPPPVKALTFVRETSPDGVKVTVTGERADGSPINASYTTKYDATPSPVSGSGAPYDTISVKQVNANTFTYTAKKTDGKYHATGRSVISHNGKTMTTTASGVDSDGKPLKLKMVYDKQ